MQSVKIEHNALICIIGPTASGKTKLAIELAKYLDAEIVSVDSRQMYRELKIGSAQPNDEELAIVKHHFIADRSVYHSLSAGQFAAEARNLIESMLKSGKKIILAGGAGFYFKALFDGLDNLPDASIEVRQEVNQLYENGGIQALVKFIEDRDADALHHVDTRNQSRLKRIAEVLIQSDGGKYADLIGKSVPFIYNPIYLGIDLSRAELYKRIEIRTDKMVETGLKSEAESLLPIREFSALNTVGYKEYFKYFDGEWKEEFAVDQIKKNTRNYAKRQMTWFRNQTNANWFETSDPDPFLKYLISLGLG
jgi:tRNA dimethylallyltransferase